MSRRYYYLRLKGVQSVSIINLLDIKNTTRLERFYMAYTIVVDRDKCQGIGACVATAPDVFEIDPEGKAVVISSSGSDDTVLAAAEACPLEAISIYDEDGEQIYP